VVRCDVARVLGAYSMEATNFESDKNIRLKKKKLRLPLVGQDSQTACSSRDFCAGVVWCAYGMAERKLSIVYAATTMICQLRELEGLDVHRLLTVYVPAIREYLSEY